MSSREFLERFTVDQRRIVERARTELALFEKLNRSSMSEAQFETALKAKYVKLVQQYGDGVASLAARMFDDMRPGSLPFFESVPAESYSVDELQARLDQVIKTSRAQDVEVLSVAQRQVQRDLLDMGRRTVRRNVARDSRNGARYARVPSGAKTCAWCAMLASRGFVYATEDTAGKHHKYHTDCDCMIVPSWSKTPKLDGYDPDGLYSSYMEARRSIKGNATPREIAARMRELNPDSFTDSHIPDADKRKPGPKPSGD